MINTGQQMSYLLAPFLYLQNGHFQTITLSQNDSGHCLGDCILDYCYGDYYCNLPLCSGKHRRHLGILIGEKPRRFPKWGARQQPIKICPLCCSGNRFGFHCFFKFTRKHAASPDMTSFFSQVILRFC